ncbi:hypothetical protein [Tateyamaria pelophila]|uniref:hypothetical protein n=1 Tax=Tateyamaria pelophila TaxID=328415 RepID=UPI001CBBACB0|nr:hypothetical protein [Tateyamaria pelophila]
MAALIEKLTTRRKAATKGAGDARKALSELRQMGSRLRDQRADIEARPVPLAEAQDAAAQAVLREAEGAIADLNLSSLTRPQDCRTPTLSLDARQMAMLAFASQAEGMAALLSAALAEQYRDMPQGIAADERAATLAKIDADLLACELAEEATVREQEREGAAPLRRGDADPRAVLANDAELR